MGLTREEAERCGIGHLFPEPEPTPAPIRRPKYRNVATEYNGIRYDSKGEANHARKLDLDQAAGLIHCWFRQITVRLGCPENVMRVDFLVVGSDGVWFDEFKGKDTPKFVHDCKLWRKYGPLPLHVIRRGKVVEIVTHE